MGNILWGIINNPIMGELQLYNLYNIMGEW